MAIAIDTDGFWCYTLKSVLTGVCTLKPTQGGRTMGFYVNPPNESKESFLKREGMAAPNSPKITWDSVPKGYLPVVLLNNGFFTAAGIAYCEGELSEFTRLDDDRPREIFMVKVEKLIPVADPGFKRYAEQNSLI